MYKLCKTEQSAQRQRELELELLEMMSVHHYDEISVSDLCDHIGIPRKTFYRYFSGKDGALHALLDHTLMEYEAHSMDTLSEQQRYPVNLEMFFGFWKSQKCLLDALHKSQLTGVLFNRCLSHARSVVAAQSCFLPNQRQEVREYALMFGVCGLMSLVTQWHSEGYLQPPQEMARIAEKIMSEPLFG